jgi:hypothetical protein
MWKGEWKAWVFYWVGLPLMSLVLGGIAVSIVSSRHPRDHGPAWASRALTEVRVLDRHFKVVRVLDDRAELEEFAAWFHRADEVATRSGSGWSHKLDINASGGGRWLYDETSGEVTYLSVQARPVYRLQQADRARFSAMLAAGPQPTRQGDGDPTKGR